MTVALLRELGVADRARAPDSGAVRAGQQPGAVAGARSVGEVRAVLLVTRTVTAGDGAGR